MLIESCIFSLLFNQIQTLLQQVVIVVWGEQACPQCWESNLQRNHSLGLICHWERGLPCWPTRGDLIRPENVLQLFHPFTLNIVQPLLEFAHYDLINSLGLPIPLWIAEVEYLFLMPKSQQYLLKALLSNWRPLSVMRVWGIPNRVTIFFQTNLLASTSVIFANGSTSTHLVK